MNRRAFLRLGTMAAGSGLALPFSCSRQFRSRRPNILFLFADDLSYEAIGALGGEVRTPNLDRLVRAGVSFSNAYNQGSWQGAVCVASRTMMLTGRFLWHAAAIEASLETEAGAGRLWPQYLERAGYDTYMSGKWHVEVDARNVFMTTRNIRGGMPAQSEDGYGRPTDPDHFEAGWKPWESAHGGYWEGGRHWSEVLADDSLGFLERAGSREDPFFMYLAFNAPHDPRQSPREFVSGYPLDEVRVPENFLPEYPYKDDIGCGQSLRDERLAPFPRTEYAIRVNRQEYYAIISHLDVQVGRILDALEETGKKDDTFIFFTADQGLAVGHHGLMGKQNMFEHSVRAPLLACGPGLPAGSRIETPVYIQDIFPSTLELAGIPVPQHVQFRSLLPLIHGERAENYGAIYGGYIDLQRMVRKGKYKLIYYPALKKSLLFDLEADPLEMRDLAGNVAYAETVRSLKQDLRGLQGEAGDTLAIPSA